MSAQVLDSGLSESPDDLSDLLRQRDTGRNAETEALTAHFFPERKFEGELTRSMYKEFKAIPTPAGMLA